MSALARIAKLHRELAEAYEELARDEVRPEPARKKRLALPEQPARPEVIDQVRRGLRRRGVVA